MGAKACDEINRCRRWPRRSRTSAGPATRARASSAGYDGAEHAVLRDAVPDHPARGAAVLHHVRQQAVRQRHLHHRRRHGHLGPGVLPATGGNYPTSYRGALFFSDYAAQLHLGHATPGADGLPNTATVANFVTGATNLVDLQIGPNDDLFYVDRTSGGTVRTASATRRPPPSPPPTRPSAPAPLTVQFNGTHVHQGLARPTRSPTPGISTATASTTTRPRGAQLHLRHRGHHQRPPAGHRPASARTGFSNPPDHRRGQPARAGDRHARPPAPPGWSATDHQLQRSRHRSRGRHPARLGADLGAVPASTARPIATPTACRPSTGVASGSFPAPDHEYPSYLRLVLRATDSHGMQHHRHPRSAAADGGPHLRQPRRCTSPGLELGFNLESAATPFTRTVIVGSAVTVSARQPERVGGTSYTFQSWSDGGAANHSIVAAGQRRHLHRHLPVVVALDQPGHRRGGRRGQLDARPAACTPSRAAAPTSGAPRTSSASPTSS